VELPLRSLFEAPSLARFAAGVEAALRGGVTSAAPRLRPSPRKGPLPLSFSQERLWVLEQMQPGMPLYNLPVAFRVRGDLSTALLAAVLREVVRRHEVLRTRFAAVDGVPEQRIEPPRELPIPGVDLTGLPAPAGELDLARLADAEARRPFDLARGPVLRALRVDLAPAEQALLFNFHHIASDGWSMGVLTREVTALYDAFSKGRPSPLPELPIQYVDYALWQRQWLAGEVLAEQVSYWRERLAGVPKVLDLPADRPVPQALDVRGSRRSRWLTAELSSRLQELGRRERATLFMVLLAAFEVLLSRHTHQDLLAIGTPIANRHRAETEGLIGFFVNTLVLVADLSGEPTFAEILSRARESSLGAYAHQDLPFEKLVEELEPQRDLSGSPLFEAFLVLQNTPRQDLELPALRLAPLEGERASAKFALTLAAEESGGGLRLALDYPTRRFEAVTVERLLGRLALLLASVAEEPRVRVPALPLLTPEERCQLLGEWNDTAVEPAAGAAACLHEWIAEQSAKTPDAVAVREEERALSYGGLMTRAERLATRLRDLRVGPEVLVGLAAEPGLGATTGLLGILCAGGAYVPLDPHSPAERLSRIVEDAGLALVLVAGRGVPSGAVGQVRMLDVEEGVRRSTGYAGPALAARAGADNLAYVLYTSGSTGRPKGVAVAHRAVVNYVRALVDRLRPEPGASFLQVQPLTVDSSVTSIFPPLVSGGCLHAVARARSLDAPGLADLLVRQPVAGLKIAPSHLQALRSAAPRGAFLPGRWLIVGGEASRASWLRGLVEEAPECAVFNHYGPTEATVGMLMHRCDDRPRSGFSESAPVGRPLDNCRSYLLDEELGAVPLGVLGRLYIGGECLARGYLGRADQTAESFIPDPYSGMPGARLYDSGDLMRHTPEGELVFAGRCDHQVKIRGHRIELGEVAATLGRHPAIAEVAVQVWQESPTSHGLVAYVVPRRPGQAPDMRELRRFLADKLPDFMRPSAVVELAELPRTPHGKLDAKALPQPLPQGNLRAGRVAPRTPIEELLAEIWIDLLGLEQVGVEDDFFELGGHSLQAVRLMSRILDVFSVEIKVQVIFESPTIEGLAWAISDRLVEMADETLLAEILAEPAHEKEEVLP
jgi:amino acid adenylation domain-containing protein